MPVPSGVSKSSPKTESKGLTWHATSAMKGIKLLGMPKGLSPISPEQCAPTGLKYLKRTAERMGKKFKTKLKNNSDDTNKGLLNGFAEFRQEKKASVEPQPAPCGTLKGRLTRNAGGVVRCGMRCRSRIDLRAWNGNGSFCT